MPAASFASDICDCTECKKCNYLLFVERATQNIAVEWISRFKYPSIRFIPPNSCYANPDETGLYIYYGPDQKAICVAITEFTASFAKQWRQKMKLYRAFQ